jgi:phosphate transport system substrate-binding protein
MTVAAIQNPSGNLVMPTLDSTQSAAESASTMGLPAGNADWGTVNILNAPGAQAYPIVSFSYIIVYQELNVIPGMTQDKATALVKFLWYVVHSGQQLASGLEYAPLPTNVVQIDESTIQSITFNGQHLPTN